MYPKTQSVLKSILSVLVLLVVISNYIGCIEDGGLATNPQAPVISSIDPAEGVPGDEIGISGNNLEQVDTVWVNGLLAPVVAKVATSLIFRITTDMTSGPVTVKNAFGTALGPDLTVLELVPAIEIDSVRPSTVARGDSVSIHGRNFDLLSPAFKVLLDQAESGRILQSSELIQAFVPDSANTGNVRLVTDGDTITGPVLAILGDPTISIISLSPPSGLPGSDVIITGENFDLLSPGYQVFFNGTPAQSSIDSPSEITTDVPFQATTGPVTIVDNGSTITGPDFTVLDIAPVITSISPTIGPVGAQVTISGENFGVAITEVRVEFNGTEAIVSSIADNELLVTVPAGATTGTVTVTLLSNGNTATGPVFTVQAVSPVINSIDPASGPTGAEVTITGQNFGTVISNVQVDFNGEVATINSLNDTQIVATVPDNATTGPVSVTLLSSGNSASGPVFTVEDNLPVITSISPTSGPIGTEVTIIGNNFGFTSADVEVRLNGQLIEADFVDLTEIRFSVPFDATTGVIEVTVVASGQTAQGPVFTVEVPVVTLSTLAGAGPNDGVDGPFQGVETNGTMLFSNAASHQLKRVDAAGVVTLFAGTGQAGFVNGRLNVAQFNFPAGMAMDSQGNIYIADVNNHVIRVIVEVFDPVSAGTRLDVQTLAGIGQPGYADGLAQQEAQFDRPSDVVVSGNILYISDFGNHAIRALDLQTGIVSTVAGDGTAGFNDGNIQQSQLNSPVGITLDNNGDLIIADALNHSIRRLLTASNFLLTVSGFQGMGLEDGLNGVARFNLPYDVVTDSQGTIYVADSGNNGIRKICGGFTTTLAGGGPPGLQDGEGSQARFNFPSGIIRVTDTEYWICDFNNDRIRKMEIGF